MTEAEWLACDDPDALLSLVDASLSERKCRLLRIAFWRRNHRQFDGDDWCLSVLHWNERAADDASALDDPVFGAGAPPLTASDVSGAVGTMAPEDMGAHAAGLIRDVVGYPLRPAAFAPAWRTAAVMEVARAAYEHRELPEGLLEPARLAVLADALEEAGCTDEAILSHLRSPGPHVRGCWALDLALGRP